MVVFEAEFEVPKHFSQKNDKQIHINKKTNRRFIGTARKTSYAKSFLLDAISRKKIVNKIFEPYPFPVNVKILFYYSMTKAGKPEKRVIDLDNLYGGVQDALQKAGVITDDSLIFGHDGSRRLHHDGPRKIKITVTKCEDYQTTKDGFHYIDKNSL